MKTKNIPGKSTASRVSANTASSSPGSIRALQTGVYVAILLIFIIELLIAPFSLAAKIRLTPLFIGKVKFTVEIADTDEKQTMGLMFRRSIPDDFGMLFVYEDEDTRSFWMKNTLVHLDLIYLDRDKQVVDIFFNVPPCKCTPCETYTSKQPAKYVLELRGNRAKELNIKFGDTLFFLLNDI